MVGLRDMKLAERKRVYRAVWKLRDSDLSFRDMAEKYGIGSSTVGRIMRRQGVYRDERKPKAKKAKKRKLPPGYKPRDPMPSLFSPIPAPTARTESVILQDPCKRCDGQLHLLPDEIHCVQCGWVRYGGFDRLMEETA